jgi:hypothetical protein
VRDLYRKLALLGHELLNADEFFSYSRLFKNGASPSGKSYLTLLWIKQLISAGLIDSHNQVLTETFSSASRYLNQIHHPMNQPMWNFFIDSPPLAKSVSTFWQTISDTKYDPVWRNPESLGWLFQYFLEPGLETYRSRSSAKIKESHLSLRTQQFTPEWIADFLVQNTIGRLWYSMHSDSRLVLNWEYFVPAEMKCSPCEIKRAIDIKILDPACGTMHLGLAAFKILKQCYHEEYINAGKTGWPEIPSVDNENDIPRNIVSENLFGIDLDPIALEISALVLTLACGKTIPEKINLLQADSLKSEISSLLRNASFPSSFDIILLNPPYLDKRDYNPKMKAYMARHYKHSGRNLYTAFLEQSMHFLSEGGRLGAVTPQTFMFISSFDKFRQALLQKSVIETLVHTGLNTFEDAVVDCAFYVLRKESQQQVREAAEAKYFQLTALTSPEEKNRQMLDLISQMKNGNNVISPMIHTYRQSDYSAISGSPWVYWIGSNIRRLFRDLPSLGFHAELRQGLATTNNERFLRFWWEVPRQMVAENCHSLKEAAQSGKKWFPYIKGGGFRKWYGNRQYLVDWGDDGREIKKEITKRYPYLKGQWQWVAKNTDFYFREGVTYSYLTSGKFSARLSPAGSIFDVAGSSIFSNDPIQLLGILNSRFCRFALGLINNTVNFQVGDLAKLPIPSETSPILKQLVTEAIALTRQLETFDETSPEFVSPAPWQNGCELIDRINQRLDDIQQKIDCEVYRLYQLDNDDRKLIEAHTLTDDPPEKYPVRRLAEDWFSYAVGIALGRFHITEHNQIAKSPFLPLIPDKSDDFHIFSDETVSLCTQVTRILFNLFGSDTGYEILRHATQGETIISYLSKAFFERHYRQYQHRPVYWLLKKKNKLYSVYYQNLNDQTVRDFFQGRKITFHIEADDGVRLMMKRFKKHFALATWSRGLK